ncbi:MAG: hypothetical protein ACKOAJ_05755, partial [Actinomycetota bacterium]
MRPVDGHGAGDAGSLGRTLAEALEKVRALEAERVEMRRRQEDQERANQEMAARQRALEAER